MHNDILYEARAEFLSGSAHTGVLVIHGFTGSTQSMRDVAYALHQQGYSVSLPRLKGHGTTVEEMESTHYTDWIDSVKEAYDTLATKVKEVFVLGLSMGGSLALYCAIHFKVKGIITINACAYMIPVFQQLYDNPHTKRFITGIGSDIKKAGVTELAYSQTPKESINELRKLLDEITENIPEITCPILIFKSLEDHIVPAEHQDYIFDHVGSEDKQLIELKNSYHVATLDNDSALIIRKSIAFIEAHKN